VTAGTGTGGFVRVLGKCRGKGEWERTDEGFSYGNRLGVKRGPMHGDEPGNGHQEGKAWGVHGG